MALTPGTRLGVFQLTELIGRGGMGEVYRARDTKLDRDVAIKVLPAAFANDSERLARLTREAKTLASLNHPNIVAIHGLEESDGITALVMELVEGDDKERYYLAPDATMMAVPVTAAAASFEAGTPVALFPTRIVDGGTVAQNRPVRGRARRPVPEQPAGGGRHRRADHADSELAGEAVSPRKVMKLTPTGVLFRPWNP